MEQTQTRNGPDVRVGGPIRCHFGRYSPKPCQNPATIDAGGPLLKLLCEEHARDQIEERFPQGWAEHGAEGYARYCEEAVTFLHRYYTLEEGDGRLHNPVLLEILEEAHAYLDRYELPKARRRLIAEGGSPHPTSSEMERLEIVRGRLASSWGLKELPPWVSAVEAWAEHAEREREAACT